MYSSIEKELREIGLFDKTALSITVYKNNNVYYSTILAGVFF
ncbi:hypothetical protein [Spiroplasma kunkelii]|nr:hypothetical protein [Spiroplasma kunkelii]